jgi:oligopeptide transport system substrate-binding protein
MQDSPHSHLPSFLKGWSRRDFFVRTSATLTLSGLAASVLEACGGGASNSPAAANQTFRPYLNVRPGTLDPNLQQWVYESQIGRNTFEALLRPKPDLSDVTPGAAAAMPQISADGKTWTFKLRPDGRWSDGKPVVAQDFVYGFQRILDPTLAAPYANYFFAAIKGGEAYQSVDPKNTTQLNTYLQGLGIHAPDDQTVVIELQQPLPYFKWIASIWVAAPARKDIVANNANWANDPKTAISNGWYKLSENGPGLDHITLVPNEHYSGIKPQLQKITMPIITDISKAYASYQNGELDMVDVPQADTANNANNPELIKEPQLTVFWVTFNVFHPPFDNKLLRQAMAKAIDRNKLVQNVLHGRGIAATTFIPKGMNGYRPDFGSYQQFDVSAAKKLLSQSKVSPATINQAQLAYRADRPDDKTVAEFLAAELNGNLGLNVQLNPVESKQFSRNLLTGDFAFASLVGWGADYPDQQDWFDTVLTPTSLTKRGNNFSGYSNPAYDKLVNKADTSLDESHRNSLYAQAHQMLCADVPQLYLYQRTGWVLAKSYVKGIQPAASDDYPFVGDFNTPGIYIASH